MFSFGGKKADRRKSASERRQPRLDRRNAAKNIDYEASWASTSSDELPFIRTSRSLDLSPTAYSRQTSIRIGGSIEGEVELLYQNLGLSGPEDFAISAAAWEESVKKRDNCTPVSNVLEDKKTEVGILGEQIRAKTAAVLSEEIRAVGDEPVETSRSFVVRSSADGGIKGPRPPVLTPPPPPVSVLSSPPVRLSLSAPAKTRTVIDGASPSGDIVRCFSRADESEDGDRGRLLVTEGEVDDVDEGEKDDEDEGEEDVEDEVEKGVGVTITGEVLELALSMAETSEDGIGSFSTSIDDDSSSTTTEVVISPNGRFKKKIRSWMRGHLLGSGSFGTVYEGISDDGTFIAVKEVSLLEKGSNAQQCILQLEQEIALLSQFEHENIVQYYGTDKEESKLFIFLELVTQGSLASLYQKYHLRDTQVSAYTRQILNGLMYLHERNVVHRDIKCANILVHANGSVKLADFGLAKEISRFNDLKSCKGSVYWMAPEVIHPKKTYGRAADIWSLGCTVLEMLTRQIPFPNVEWQHAFYRIGRGDQPPVPHHLSKDAQDFIKLCVQVDPDSRPTAAQLLQHPFVHRSPSLEFY
ncbi:hypothetical protein HPP92_026337 [Vanilla planifolia]|uniref:mitogen-activated protein kinase kinase kinase n=1 Tax=Vanilla planifolia TaxID=51239 RepID=A0A835PDX0_VANPL|nr:hypothetical protein HPP92_026337 [Vanilla planifolia]